MTYARVPPDISLVPTASEKKLLQQRIADTGGMEALLVRFAEGQSLQTLANAFGCKPAQIASLLRQPEWKEKYEHAKKIKAELAIDKGLEAVNMATPETASVAKLQWEAQRWVAGKLDSDAYGDKPQVAVQVNLGSLHLDALRAFNTDSDPLS